MSCAAINSSEAMLRLCISLPIGREVGFTNTQWIQMAFAMLISYRHTATMPTSNQTSSLIAILSQLRERLEGLSTTETDMNGQRDIFHDFKNKVTQVEESIAVALKSEKHAHHHQKHDDHLGNEADHTVHADDIDGHDSFEGFIHNAELGHGMFDDLLFSTSLDQIMNSWL